MSMEPTGAGARGPWIVVQMGEARAGLRVADAVRFAGLILDAAQHAKDVIDGMPNATDRLQ
jgi:hypothetical protein